MFSNVLNTTLKLSTKFKATCLFKILFVKNAPVNLKVTIGKIYSHVTDAYLRKRNLIKSVLQPPLSLKQKIKFRNCWKINFTKQGKYNKSTKSRPFYHLEAAV